MIIMKNCQHGFHFILEIYVYLAFDNKLGKSVSLSNDALTHYLLQQAHLNCHVLKYIQKSIIFLPVL